MTNEEKAQQWLGSAEVPEELKTAIKNASKDQIDDMFYRELEFGTGGMRGVLGPGTNRMNVLTVRKVSVGFAMYLLKTYPERAKKDGVVISHDNRTDSRVFTLLVSQVLNDFGINTFIFDSLRPTPELSFSVRYLHAVGGIMITASHNPKEYNGYKVYDDTGCQLVPEQIQPYLDIVEGLGDPLTLTYKKDPVPGSQVTLDNKVDDAFMKKVHSVAINGQDKHVIKIVFTPQHGTSSVLGRRLFAELGYKTDEDFFPVLDQCTPDPLFSHTLTPNPEMKDAYNEAIEIAKAHEADLVLTTDPDADRVGLAFRDSKGEYELYTGNQTGALLINYVLGERAKRKELKPNSVLCDTIVTSTLGEKIAKHYGCGVRSFLTGFKYIGAAMNRADTTHEFTFEFGYEESYGYIFADFCRDKDSLESLLMIAEMVNHYKLEGKTLDQKLDELYQQYGYHICKLFNIYFPGEEGLHDMQKIMTELRDHPFKELSGIKVVSYEDYLKQVKHEGGKTVPLTGFPVSDVLRFFLEDGSWLAIRPSGTEPKCKFYYEAVDKVKEKAEGKPDAFHKDILHLIGLDKK
jgi:phosphoglucomutase